MLSVTGKARGTTALMAIATGAAFAGALLYVPVAAIEWRIVQTGLPAILPAAAPPLGFTARALMAGIGGIGAMVVAWIAFTLIDSLIPGRAQARRPRIEPFAEWVPDAAVRRPIFAESDLGAPFNSIRAAPHVLDLGTLPFEGEPAPLAAPVTLDMPAAPAPEAAPVVDAAPLWKPDPWFDDLLEPEPVAADPAKPDAPRAPTASLSLAELVERLETGMHRRRSNAGAAPRGRPDIAPLPDMDAALRDALGTLQRLSLRSL